MADRHWSEIDIVDWCADCGTTRAHTLNTLARTLTCGVCGRTETDLTPEYMRRMTQED